MTSFPIHIDGREVVARTGDTVLDVALAHGIAIPHLCYEPRLTATAGCRLCVVELAGRPGLHTACTCIVEEGMIVHANTEAVRKARRGILELLLSEHDLRCTTCDKDGDCLLQDYAYEYGANEAAFPRVGLSPYTRNFSTGNVAFRYDPSKCIRCERCVKACAEIQGCQALTMQGRAGNVRVAAGLDVALYDSSCEACGQCISVCPVGALYERNAVGRGKAKDFIKTRTTCPYCGVGCQLDLNVHRKSGRIVRVTSAPGVTPNDGALCVKGRFGMDFVGSPERLSVPLIKQSGVFREASWDEALDLAASRFTALKERHGPDALACLSSAKTTNEDNYIMQKLARAVFQTNNIDHCARLCHASTVAGLARAFGSGAMTNSIEELRRTPLIFVIGSNTTECHPVIGIFIRQAVMSGNTTLIVADPRRIPLASIAHVHLRHRPGTDVALINAFLNVILEEGLEDRDFIAQHTEGFDAIRGRIGWYTPERVAAITGTPADQIRHAARLYASAPGAAVVYSMGITQHVTGTDNVLALANLAMATGNVGRECTGVNPLRGQNNVQGACDMGALPNMYPGYQPVTDPGAREKFEHAWQVSLPGAPGLTMMEMIRAAHERTLRGMYIMGENGMLSEPDIGHVREGLESLDFLVVQDIFLTETAQLADVVFPAACFAERAGSVTNTERRVQRLAPAVAPPGQAREDWRILCEVATRMGYAMSYPSHEAITDEIASLTPIYGGITHDRLGAPGLQWPCPTRDHPGTKFLHAGGNFTRGKGKFHPVDYLDPAEQPDEAFPFILTTGRILEHYHTGSMSRRSLVLDDRVPHGCLELHPEDAAALNIEHNEQVRVESRRGRIELPANITDRVPRGTLFVAWHFAEHPANALTIAALDPVAKIPEYKVAAARVCKLT